MAFKNLQPKETKTIVNEPYDPIRMVVEHDHLLKSYLLLRLLKNKPKASSFWDLSQLEHELLLHLSRLICGDVENLNLINPREIYEYLLDRYKNEIDSSFCLSGGGGRKGGPRYAKTNRSSVEEQQDLNLTYYFYDDTEINDPNVKRLKNFNFFFI